MNRRASAVTRLEEALDDVRASSPDSAVTRGLVGLMRVLARWERRRASLGCGFEAQR